MSRNNNNNVTNQEPDHTYITIQSNASVSWGGDTLILILMLTTT